jgi:hypothetical protein
MVFVDVLLRNYDRHNENYKLKVSPFDTPEGLLPLFDHDLCLLQDSDDDYYLFKWSADVAHETYWTTITKVYAEFPDRIKELIAAAETLPSDIPHYDFIVSRLQKIKEVLNL